MKSFFTTITKKIFFLIIIILSPVYSEQTVLFNNLGAASSDYNNFPIMAQQFQTTANLRFIHEVVLNIYEGSESGNFSVSIHNYISDFEIGGLLVTLYSGNKTALPDDSTTNFVINSGILPYGLTASTIYWIVVTSDAGSVNWNYCSSDDGTGDGFLTNNYYFDDPDHNYSFTQPFRLKITADNVLPVELNSFTSSVSDKNVILNWQTATEINNYGFEVERSVISGQWSANATADNLTLNAESWTKIGFVEGNGNSNSPKEYSFTDNNLNLDLNLRLCYRLKQIDNDGKFEYSDVVEVDVNLLPSEFALYQNYPNPFNPSTVISYQLPANSLVTLELFAVTGEKVGTLVNGEQEAGYYNYELNSAKFDLTSGIYFYRLRTGEFVNTKKLILLK